MTYEGVPEKAETLWILRLQSLTQREEWKYRGR